MILRPPRSTRTDSLFPYTTLFRSKCARLDSDYTMRAVSGHVGKPAPVPASGAGEYLRDGQAVRKFEELLGRGIEHDGGGAMGHLRPAHSAGHDRISRQFRIPASLMAGKVGNIPVNRNRRSPGAMHQNQRGRGRNSVRKEV